MNSCDYLVCDLPLPRAGFNQEQFQTQAFEKLEKSFHIKSDGSLWTQCQDNPQFQQNFCGPVSFFTTFGPEYLGGYGQGWVEFCAHIEKGVVKTIDLVKISRPYIG